MSETKPIRIKAFWSIYGPKFQMGGKRIDCVSDTSLWSVAVSDLDSWIDRNHPGASVEFYGTSAEFAKKEWDELQTFINSFSK